MTFNEMLCMGYGAVVATITRGYIMKNLIARVLAWFGGSAVQKIVKSIPEIVVAVEADYIAAAADGKITPDERKDLAMKTINAAAEKLGLKMNFVTKWVISTIVDNIAKRLPSKDLDITGILNIAKGIGV